MGKGSEAARRLGYDKFWGGLLVFSCVLPMAGRSDAVSGGQFVWNAGAAAFRDSASVPLGLWLLSGTLTGVVALVLGLLALRTRWRHLVTFALAVVTIALPLLFPRIWSACPDAGPAALPIYRMQSLGWVTVAGLVAIYAGSGVRLVRRSHVLGIALAGLGAFLLAIFAFLPLTPDQEAVAGAKLLLLPELPSRWRELVPFMLVALAVCAAMANTVRGPAEVLLAKAARALLVGALVFWLFLPFLEGGDARVTEHLPRAWGAIRFFAPLFLALNACLAFTAISITRAED